MTSNGSVMPKAATISMHTGNIVNWNRLKKKVTQTATEELSECLQYTLESFISTANKDELLTATSVVCQDDKFIEKIADSERANIKLTVKICLYELCSKAMTTAVQQAMTELDTGFVETVILSVPPQYRNLESLLPLWKQLENQVDSEVVLTLGVADLEKQQLEDLYNAARVKPCINQVNLQACCVIPADLNAYAKANHIQLLTHNDPADILPACGLQEILANSIGKADSEGWVPCWVIRYSVLMKGRGVLKSKGYIASAAHFARHGCMKAI